jgi:hypothetical protein
VFQYLSDEQANSFDIPFTVTNEFKFFYGLPIKRKSNNIGGERMSDLEGWSSVIDDESKQEDEKVPLKLLAENPGQKN